MLLRELTTDIKKPINEWWPFGVVIDQLFATPTAKWDTMDAPSQLYNNLISKGESHDYADSLATELKDQIAKSGPTPEILQKFQNITGIKEVPWEFRNMKAPVAPNDVVTKPNGAPKELPVTQPRDGGNPGGITTAPTTGPVGNNAPVPPTGGGAIVNRDMDFPGKTAPGGGPYVPLFKKQGGGGAQRVYPPASVTKPKINPKPPKLATPDISNIPSSVTDGAGLNQVLKGPQSGWADGIAKTTKLSPAGASKLVKYGLPAAGVLALLYGGKKLYDYFKKKK